MEYAEVVERALDEGSDDRDDLRGLEGQEGAGDSAVSVSFLVSCGLGFG